jgi:digeranylgeranylglycerophospholipid reductase
MDHDIIIVGAGPSGLCAGYYAALAGADVLILDKKHELGKPVRCGEAVIENVFKDFKIKPTADIVANTVNGMKCISPRGKELFIRLNISGYILNREKFEELLGKRAIKKGAKIQLDTTVIGLNKNELIITENNGKTTRKISGRIIIGADGVESRIGRWAKLISSLKPPDIAVCIQYFVENVKLNPETVEFYWGGEYSQHGYIWVFPKSENSANIGIASPGSYNKELKEYLEKFIKTRAPNGKIHNQVMGCVPQAMPPEKLVKDNIMLIGDAARVAIPVTGAGIGHAMVTGKWAGEIAGEIINQNKSIDELMLFDRKMDKIRRKISRSYRLKQKIIRDDDFFELLFGLFIPFQYIYKFSPNFIDKFVLKSLRY